MASFRTYLELCRASNLPTVWTNVLAAVVLSGAAVLSVPALLAMVSLSLMYVGGMTLNDVLDVDEDRARKPSRPIPWRLAGVSLVDGALLAVLVSPPWIAAGLGGAALTRLAQINLVRGD